VERCFWSSVIHIVRTEYGKFNIAILYIIYKYNTTYYVIRTLYSLMFIYEHFLVHFRV
jgi:hypothetical protein